MSPARNVAGLALVAFVAAGCSSSTNPSVSLGAPAIHIAELAPTGGPSWKPGSKLCVELGRDPAETIGVKIALTNWTLRPPYGCSGTPQCGYVRLRIDPNAGSSAFQTIAAATLVSVPMTSVAHPIGQHTFRVDLLTDSGQQAVGAHAAPLTDQVTVETGAPGHCTAPSDGGFDAPAEAAPDAPSDAPSDAADAGAG